MHRWHGDVSASAKANARHDPDGIVLITPESLEALFVLGLFFMLMVPRADHRRGAEKNHE